jgi:hypothetical protein
MGRWDLGGEIVYKNGAEGGARVVVTFPLHELACAATSYAPGADEGVKVAV